MGFSNCTVLTHSARTVIPGNLMHVSTEICILHAYTDCTHAKSKIIYCFGIPPMPLQQLCERENDSAMHNGSTYLELSAWKEEAVATNSDTSESSSTLHSHSQMVLMATQLISWMNRSQTTKHELAKVISTKHQTWTCAHAP